MSGGQDFTSLVPILDLQFYLQGHCLSSRGRVTFRDMKQGAPGIKLRLLMGQALRQLSYLPSPALLIYHSLVIR